MKTFSMGIAAAALAIPLMGLPAQVRAQYLVIGNDEKILWDDAGKAVNKPPGKDTVTIVDISNGAKPRILGSLPLMNTIVGPPVNLAVTPDERLALVVNSLDWVSDGSGGWKSAPDNKMYVIDIKASPPAQIGTVELGKQASGMAINRTGDLALVANRAENTVSVLAIKGKDVKMIDTVAVSAPGAASDSVSSVAISPNGKLALVTKAAANKIAVLKIDGQKVTYAGNDINVGVFPYNVQIAPNGKIAIVNNTGNGGSSDGHADTVGIIDLQADPPRVIDYVVVGDGPEGLAISPAGNLAVSLILNGSNASKTAFFRHDHSYISILKIDDKKVRKVGEAEVGGLAEGIGFSPDGKYLYVGNFLDSDLTIFKVQGTKLMRMGSLKLPGHPASLRTSVP